MVTITGASIDNRLLAQVEALIRGVGRYQLEHFRTRRHSILQLAGGWV